MALEDRNIFFVYDLGIKPHLLSMTLRNMELMKQMLYKSFISTSHILHNLGITFMPKRMLLKTLKENMEF